jgi:hypothetical protein
MTWNRRAYRDKRKHHIAQVEKERKQNHPEQYRLINRRYYLKKAFGITPDEWDAKFAAQDKKCAICGCVKPRGGKWAYDHSHASGVHRGIICMFCNTVLCKMNDDPTLLRKAAEYLEKHATQGANSSNQLPPV